MHALGCQGCSPGYSLVTRESCHVPFDNKYMVSQNYEVSAQKHHSMGTIVPKIKVEIL